MAKKSAGLLMFRRHPPAPLEVFLVHPGGPFWAAKNLGAWSLPKGEYADTEDPLDAACREFREETGFSAVGPFLELSNVKQPSGKWVHAWAFEGDADPAELRSNTFSMEWPKGSGTIKDFLEVDKGAWFAVSEARRRILPGQGIFLERLCDLLGLSEEERAASPSGTRSAT